MGRASKKFAKELGEHRVAQLAELLASLRDDLREELKLDRVEGPLVFCVLSLMTRRKGNPC
jgi:hypothetical protein